MADHKPATNEKSSSKKNVSGIAGVKMLITATSLAATLGGWVILANSGTSQVSGGAPLAEVGVVSGLNSGQSRAQPLPTLVPLLVPLPVTTSGMNAAITPAAPATNSRTTQQEGAKPAITQPIPTPSLPSVSAPAIQRPAPVARTRSSR